MNKSIAVMKIATKARRRKETPRGGKRETAIFISDGKHIQAAGDQ